MMPYRDHATLFHTVPILCIWGVLALVACRFAGAGTAPHFERISDDTGISHRSVFAIEQDHQGFLWIGTADGLNRFDGRECRVWRHDGGDPNSLCSNVVHVVFEDRNEQLWVGTANGLERFDRSTGVFEHIDLNPHEGAENRPNIQVITEFPTGDLWVGGIDFFAHYEVDTGTFRVFSHDPSDPQSLPQGAVVEIDQDLEGDIWTLSSSWGARPLIMSQLRRDGTLHHYPAPPGWECSGGFTIDQSGRFWINVSGVGTFDSISGRFDLLLSTTGHEALGRSTLDHLERVLMPAIGGLVRFDPHRGIREFLTFSDDQEFLADLPIFAFEDRAKALWVGTRGGLYVNDPNQKSFSHLEYQRGDPSSLASNQISAVLEDTSGDVWVGTFGGGLHRIDKEGNLHRYQHDPMDPQSLCHDIVWDLTQDDRGNLWIAYEFGLCLYTADDDSFSGVPILELPPQGGPNSRITTVLEAPNHTLWIGSTFGLLRYDPTTGKSNQVLTKDREWPYCNINTAVEGRDGTLWVAGGNACSRLFRLDTSEPGTALELEVVESVELESEGIFDLFEDEAGIIWLATVSGLGRLDPKTGVYEIFTTRDGLPGTSVYSMLQDDQGYLWLGTNRGLSRFDPREADPQKFKNYSTQDGIPSVEFNRHAALAASDGRFYFGGMHGLTIFSPSEIRDNPVVPPVELTGIKVWGRDGSRKVNPYGCTELHLESDENSFEIRFAALNFTNAGANQFRYRLHPHDPVENDGGTTGFARYTQVKPGRYRFEVLGSNNDLVWNNEGASLMIIIDPPFWQSWWGRSLFVITLIAAVFGAHRYRVSKLLEVERLRWRIAADLHDDLSSDLSGVALAASLLKRRGLSSRAETERLSEIENTSRSMVDRLRDVVWCVNPEHDSFDAVVRRMRLVAASLLADVEYHFEVELPGKGPGLAMSHRRTLLLIFKECLHNISRHAGATEVNIRLTVDGNVLTLEITDNGKGFSPDASYKGQGLASMKRRASSMPADFKISSTIGEGSTITLVSKMARIRGVRN